MNIKLSADIDDIVAINKRSAEANGELRILELGTLGDIISRGVAESIRKQWLKNGIKTRQLTNLQQFQAWTEVPDFVEQCMEVRYVTAKILPINVETLIFDDVVALYQLEPIISLVVVEHTSFAAQQKALFDGFWEQAHSLKLREDGSTE